jgi:hypothetical protein
MQALTTRIFQKIYNAEKNRCDEPKFTWDKTVFQVENALPVLNAVLC